ncbi:MAG: WYL domain-containing protein [Clostridia bacterium]|nr:WYL domain-containing protein [Clostridia bacterium]
MATKNRIVYLMQYLRENSDENKPVTTAQIREEMANKGCPIIIPTLRDDIEALQSAGYDIQVNETEGLSTTYSWLDREWSQPELQILVDAVSSSQFITKEKSRELIEKLVRMGAPSFRESLKPQILVSEHVKAPNQQILLSVQAIRRAIDRDHKITFKYMEYTVDKKQVPRHEGTPEEEYIVSPYATIWNNDRYYLVGFSDRRQHVNTFRVDRMMHVKQIQKKRVPEPEDFNIQDYTDKVFWMYNGNEEEVTLRCRKKILDQVIDRFGEGIELKNTTEEMFDVTVPVCISGTFYAWVVQFVGEMNIVEPVRVKEAFVRYLQDAIDDAHG